MKTTAMTIVCLVMVAWLVGLTIAANGLTSRVQMQAEIQLTLAESVKITVENVQSITRILDIMTQQKGK